MNNLLCHTGNLGSLASWGTWDWIGMILHMVFWVGLLVGLVLLVAWAVRRARIPVATGPPSSGQPTEMEILQARNALGDITSEQYESGKQKDEK